MLLPGGQLPLNIFEPRYLQMIDDALGGVGMIGMVQPRDEAEGGTPPAFTPSAARAASVVSRNRRRALSHHLERHVSLRIARELAVDTPYRQALID